MRLRLLKFSVIVLGLALLSLSCSKDEPKPLGAQTNAVFLAGDKGKSKGWKLREFNYQIGTAAAQTATFAGCFSDNVYTFTNNASQAYDGTEGTSKCFTTDPDAIESGTWAFTLDGLILNVSVDETQTPNGLFSPEIYVDVDANNNVTAIYNGGYTPYSAFVQKLDANNLILEINVVRGTAKTKYTLTFTPA